MPLYEGRHNAENVIKISEAAKNSISFTAEETVARLYDVIAAADGAVAAHYAEEYLSARQTEK